jgi:MFS family permease
MIATLAAFNGKTFISLREHRNYRLYFSGQIVSLSGTWVQDTALPWLIIQRTHSPVEVGWLLFCRYLPFTLFGLSAGVLADRFDNRRFLIGTQLASMIVAAALAALTLSGSGPLAVIFVLAFLGGTAVFFDAPSRQSLTFQLVGRDELPNAIALNSGLMNAARVIGPAIAGVTIAAVGVGVCFALNAVSFLAVLAVLLLMRTSELFPVARGPRQKGVAAIREGVAYVMREPRLATIIGLTAVISLTGFNFRVLLPALADRTLHVGATVFGILFACFGTGALAGSLFAASRHRPSWRQVAAGSGTFSLAMLALAPLHVAWAAGVLLVVIGFGFSVWSASSMSILQLAAPDALRGRVVGLYIFVFAGFAPVGSILAGWLASIGGTEAAFTVGGAAGVTASAFAAVRIRSLRSLPTRALAIEVEDVAPLVTDAL